jgi:4-alpha-glucanotransferase
MTEEAAAGAEGPVPGPLGVRRAGVLLHITSLPSTCGHGDLGPAAHAFVDFLADAGATVWQVLPLVPTHEEDRSPYNAVSAMAGNPELISIERLGTAGLLQDEEVAAVRAGAVTAGEAREKAAVRFFAEHDTARFKQWCDDEAQWLDPYVEFVTLRETLGGTPWPTWEPGLRDRDPDVLAATLASRAARLLTLRFEQWVFALQWSTLRAYAAERGVLFFGDLPIFVSYDSADVWASRGLFELDDEGRPVTVTGVPPDYFSADGQRWNNPHYDWDAMAADGFAWWRRRVARQRELFDLIRIDHFRGFEASWHVPAEAETAKDGWWVQNPGREVLGALIETSGEGTLVAEDLGVITPEVEALRQQFALPGMKVLQFAFDGDEDNSYLPAQHGVSSVVYTGTHDNDTTVGWWQGLDERTRALVRRHLLVPDEPMPWALIRLALASTARLAVVPAQDLLGLDSGSRMNTPGEADGNWAWQAGRGAFTGAIAARLAELVAAYDRAGPGSAAGGRGPI